MKRSPIKRTGWNTQGTRASRAHSRRTVALADALARPATISAGVSAEIQATCDRILKRVAPIKHRSRRKSTSMIRSDAITQSARDQNCTLQIAGFACAPNDTVVLAHIPMMGNHGAGLKTDDVCGCYACATCHALLDGRMPGLQKGSADWYFYALRGLARTLRALYDAGILTIKGASK